MTAPPTPVAPAIFTLNPNHPDVALATISRYILSAFTNLDESSVSMDDLRLVVRTLTQLSSDYLAALQSSLADRADLRLMVGALNTLVAALMARVAALEATKAVRTVALAPPVALGLLSIGTRDVTLLWDRTLPDATYEVDPWPSAGLGGLTVTVKSRTTTSVTFTVKTTTLIAAGGSLGALAWRLA